MASAAPSATVISSASGPSTPGNAAALGEQHRRRVGAAAYRLFERRDPGAQPGAPVAELVLGLPQPRELR